MTALLCFCAGLGQLPCTICSWWRLSSSSPSEMCLGTVRLAPEEEEEWSEEGSDEDGRGSGAGLDSGYLSESTLASLQKQDLNRFKLNLEMSA